MIPKTIIQNGDGDIDLSQGLRFTATLADYVIIRLRENLSFFLGEWFLDQRQGVPWFRIAGQAFDPGLVRSMLTKAAKLTPGVASVAKMTLGFDRRTRVLAIPEFKCVLKDGSIITQDDLGRPFTPVPEQVR